MKNPFRKRWETIWTKKETFERYILGMLVSNVSGIVVLQKHIEKPGKFKAYIETVDTKQSISIDMLVSYYPNVKEIINKI